MAWHGMAWHDEPWPGRHAPNSNRKTAHRAPSEAACATVPPLPAATTDGMNGIKYTAVICPSWNLQGSCMAAVAPCVGSDPSTISKERFGQHMAMRNSARRAQRRIGMTWHDGMAWHGKWCGRWSSMAWHGMVQHGMAGRSMEAVRRGVAGHGMAWHGMAGHGMTMAWKRLGMAGQGMAQQGMAGRNMEAVRRGVGMVE